MRIEIDRALANAATTYAIYIGKTVAFASTSTLECGGHHYAIGCYRQLPNKSSLALAA